MGGIVGRKLVGTTNDFLIFPIMRIIGLGLSTFVIIFPRFSRKVVAVGAINLLRVLLRVIRFGKDVVRDKEQVNSSDSIVINTGESPPLRVEISQSINSIEEIIPENPLKEMH